MAFAAGAEAILECGCHQLSIGVVEHRPCFACRGRKSAQAAIALMLRDRFACHGHRRSSQRLQVGDRPGKDRRPPGSPAGGCLGEEALRVEGSMRRATEIALRRGGAGRNGESGGAPGKRVCWDPSNRRCDGDQGCEARHNSRSNACYSRPPRALRLRWRRIVRLDDDVR